MQNNNKLKISVFNNGYLGIGDYNTSVNRKHTIQYTTWKNMLQRCYSESYHLKTPTYKECSVCKEWLNFQNFAKWFDENYIESFAMDKDILIKNNKIYSPDTCCFIPKEINSVIAGNTNRNKKLPLGVQFRNGKYLTLLTLNYKSKYYGSYVTIEEASNEIIKIKKLHIDNILNKYKNILSKSIINKIKNYNLMENNKKECPSCLGAEIIMTPKETKGFIYKTCSLCNGVGTVSKELADDFELSLNEDNLETNDDW